MEKDSKTRSIDDKVEMDTLAMCIRALEKEGYNTQFTVDEDGLKSLTTEIVYPPDKVKIIGFYRFEGAGDPGDESILYAIETNNGEKGTLADGYGGSTDGNVSDFINLVRKIQKGEIIDKD